MKKLHRLLSFRLFAASLVFDVTLKKKSYNRKQNNSTCLQVIPADSADKHPSTLRANRLMFPVLDYKHENLGQLRENSFL